MAGIGEALRSTREHRGLSIDQVAQDTRISPRFLEALEAEQFHELPAPVYVRGFLRSYANYLRIDPQQLLDQLIGGNLAAPGAREGYVGANGHNGRNGAGNRRTDPFQRGGVIAPPPPPQAASARTAPVRPAVQEDSWAPEPLAPAAPPHVDHGYIPGSDLMEAPEFGPEEYAYQEPEPVFQRRTAGVLAERPMGPADPGGGRRIALFAGGVLAVLAFLGGAVLLTRGDDDGNKSAAATGSEPTPGKTPSTVVAVGTNASSSATAAASPSASATTSTTPAGTPGATTTPGTATPAATTQGAAATQTAAPTQTPAATPTPAPTATPSPIPTPTPTPIPTIVPGNLGFGECQPTGTGSSDCGGPPYRVICYAPINPALNKNWWVDVNWDFGPIPLERGWRETTVNGPSNGDIITAGAAGCPG